MAGSLRNFQYVADDAAIYLFRADESNTEAVNVAAANIVAANVSRPGLPRNLKPRRVFYSDASKTRTLSVVASTIGIYNNPPLTIPNINGDAGVLTLTRKRPELLTLYANVDSGLTDGDAPL